jgi:NitT/TauT family transport system substrate-binding protein
MQLIATSTSRTNGGRRIGQPRVATLIEKEETFRLSRRLTKVGAIGAFYPSFIALITGTLAVLISTVISARAEINEIKIAKQYGISYLPLMLLEADHLIEKHAKYKGLREVKVTWATFSGGSVMNDAILAGDLHLASGGIGPLLTLWSATKGKLDVKCVASLNAMPLYLNTRNPQVRSIRDLTGSDKIALPAVKVSIQAVTLQMAAEKEFGVGNHAKLDALTVSLGHPDANAALVSGRGEVNAHFGSPPFQYQQLRHANIHRILNSYDVVGEAASFNFVWATTKFKTDNPKVYAAFVKALDEAEKYINANKREAAARYLQIANDANSTPEDIQSMLDDPEIEFTTVPRATMKYAEFMHKVGTVRNKPETWKDLCFENVHELPGS